LAETRERLESKLGADEGLSDDSATEGPEEDDRELGEQNAGNQTLQERIQERNQSGEAERQDASDIDPTGERQPGEPNW
jgi:hypothetical protein